MSMPPNVFTLTPANPTGPGSGTPTMMGLGVSAPPFLPSRGGIAAVTVTGSVASSAASCGAQLRLVVGGGTPPANGAAFTGTPIGAPVVATNSSLTGSVNAVFPFVLSGVTPPLPLSQPLWFDIAAAQVGIGGSVTISNLTITVLES